MGKKVFFLTGIFCIVGIVLTGCSAPTPDNVAKQVIKTGAIQAVKHAK